MIAINKYGGGKSDRDKVELDARRKLMATEKKATKEKPAKDKDAKKK